MYISPFEHNAVTRVLSAFEKRNIIKVNQLVVSESLRYDMERIKYQFDSVRPDLVIVSHASNTIGLISPFEELFSLAKEYESRTLLDMAQTAGLVNCNVGSSFVDYAVFAGHKTLYGPTGISGFVMKQELAFSPILFGGTGVDSANQDMPASLPEKYEMGTVNILGVAGLNAALKWINEISIEKIREREIQNRNRLLELLNSYWFVEIIGNISGNDYVGVVSCLINGISSESAGNLFEKCGISIRSGLHCAPLAHQFLNTYPAGTIRFSVSYFTTEQDFHDLKKALDFIDENL